MLDIYQLNAGQTDFTQGQVHFRQYLTYRASRFSRNFQPCISFFLTVCSCCHLIVISFALVVGPVFVCSYIYILSLVPFRQSLPVEQLGGKPLCMIQYYQILTGCRIPGKKKDSWTCFPPDGPDPPRHIVIIHNNTVSYPKTDIENFFNKI